MSPATLPKSVRNRATRLRLHAVTVTKWVTFPKIVPRRKIGRASSVRIVEKVREQSYSNIWSSSGADKGAVGHGKGRCPQPIAENLPTDSYGAPGPSGKENAGVDGWGSDAPAESTDDLGEWGSNSPASAQSSSGGDGW